MSLSSYTALRDAVIGDAHNSWLHRSAISGDLFNNFLQLTEEKMYIGGMLSTGRHVSGLRVRLMEKRSTATLSTSSRFLALPDNFLEARRAELEYIDSNSNKIVYPLKFVVPSELREVDISSLPTRFTVTSQYEFDVTPDLAYTMEVQHYAKASAITSSNTTGTLLTAYPSIYLYGCLYHGAMWADEPQKAIMFNDMFLDAINDANTNDRWARVGPAPQAIYHGSTP